jgi:hypothetical protein
MTRSGNMQAEDRMQREAWGMQLYCNLMKRQNERDGDGEMRMRRATCLSSLGIRKCITMNDPASKSGIAITYTSRHVMSFMIKEQDADCRMSRSERSAFEPCGRWSSFRSLPNGRVFPRARLRACASGGGDDPVAAHGQRMELVYPRFDPLATFRFRPSLESPRHTHSQQFLPPPARVELVRP